MENCCPCSLSLLIASENQQYLLLRVLGAFLTTKAANTCIAACVGGLRTPAYALQLSWTALLQGIQPSSISGSFMKFLPGISVRT